MKYEHFMTELDNITIFSNSCMEILKYMQAKH